MHLLTTYDVAPSNAAASGGAYMVRKPTQRMHSVTGAVAVMTVALGGLTAMVLVVAGISVHGTPQLTATTPLKGVAIDVALLALFAVHHQVVQTGPGLGRWLCRTSAATLTVGEFLVAGMLLGILCAGWQPLPSDVWSVNEAFLRALLWAGCAAGWVLVVLGGRVLAPLGAVLATATRREESRALAQLLGGGFLVNFCAPQMTVGHLLFAVATTAYAGICCARRMLYARGRVGA